MKSVVFRVISSEDHDNNQEHNDTLESFNDCTIPKKSRGKSKIYEEVTRYSSLIKEAVNKGFCNQRWVRSVKRTTKEGDKIFFTCSGHPRCPRSLYILLDPDCDDAVIYVSDNCHDHTTVETIKKKISSSSREKVLELIDMGVTQPRKILKELEKANLPMLTKIQISNLKARENIKVNGKATCYLNEWLLWIKQRSHIPEDDDEVFVVDHSYEMSKSNPNKIKDMRCFFTTKRLISNSLKSKLHFFTLMLNYFN